MKHLLKILAGGLISLLITAFIAVNLLAWLTRPSRLTQIIEHSVNQTIDGEISIGRADLTLWSTFPRATVAISDATLVSHSLHDAPDSIRPRLTAACDSLLSVNAIRADINLWKALRGDIRIDSVVIDGPTCRLVVADTDLANFDIIHLKHHPGAPSLPDRIKKLKQLKINTLHIQNAGESSYTSILDDSELTFRIPDLTIDGRKAPRYTLSLSTEAISEEFARLNFHPLEVSMQGSVEWDFHRPERLTLDSLQLALNDIRLLLSADMEFQTGVNINSLDFTINNLSINTLRAHIPHTMAEDYTSLETDLAFTFNLAVTDTIFLSNLAKVPDARMSLDIPECQITYGETTLSSASLSAHADIIGAELDRSSVTVDRLSVAGDGFSATVSGTATSLLSDPTFDASIQGDAILDKLPPALLRSLPIKIKGHAATDAGVNMRMSDLAQSDIHDILLTGELTIDGLSIDVDGRPVWVKAGKAVIDFGKTSCYVIPGFFNPDSRLSLSLAIDTATVAFPGNLLGLSDVIIDLGNPGKTDPLALSQKLASLIRIATLSVDAPHDVKIRGRGSGGAAGGAPRARGRGGA
ncbi:MAG: AsmA family protein, partial [Muribaculaceae bacterium]|nr:AsmA family protein [Muribaculaceae bacterium]